MKAVERSETEPKINQQTYINWETLSKELEKATFELNTLTYRLSHDFNAPLSSVLGLIDLIELEHGDVAGSYLSLMRNRINRMRDIIRDLVYSSRIQHENTVIEHADLNTIIHREIMELSDLNNFDRVKITSKIAGEYPIRTDLFRLRVILNCLISNAINYANLMHESPWVKIQAKCTSKDLQIVIKDNGIGIADEQQVKVFEMFYRGTHASNGSGLGLYLVQKALYQLGGHIRLKSQVGEGTTIKITIPNHFSAL